MTVPVELRHDLEDAANRMRISAIEMTCASKTFASHYKLDNLVAIVDANRLGQSQETSLGHKVDVYQVGAIKARFHGSQKGKLVPKKPVDDAPKVDLHVGSIKIAPPAYKLAKLGDVNPRVIGLDGDTKNSTFSEKLLQKHPQQFIECFIAEQNLVGVAVGAQCRDRTIPFTSTFAAFFTRATDQIRMAAVSFANLKCVGSHVGVSIGEDGPSQMALEDLAIFRAIPGSTVFYPSDGVSAERATELAANTKGIVFIRTGRPALPVLYQNEEPFAIGKAKIVKQSDNDKIVLIGAGVTLYECLKAAEQLEKSGVHACVIDPFTIKPLDQETIVKQAKRVGGKILTVEDHYPAGGIGEAVSSAVADHTDIRVHSICVQTVPRSGTPDELIDLYGISARHIVEAVNKF
ncbi:Transketolase, pyridine binding domain protein [Teladorsagia circumcincta]|uniref:transketolase n=1 Tax=Teladorsagia circumcincta TaxID=45464 RepID=A0A2G9U3T9_TELCI|nr:Transketolase, pyridine binding domain protein [Teladorsagia circumcincta]